MKDVYTNKSLSIKYTAEAFCGIRNLKKEVRSLRIIVHGDKRLKEKLTAWLKPSDYAATQRQAKKC